jgi:hypothetical protein
MFFQFFIKCFFGRPEKSGKKSGRMCRIEKIIYIIDLNIYINIYIITRQMCKENGCKPRQKHKKEDDNIDVIPYIGNKLCAHTNCKKKPTYNKVSEASALYCPVHKKEGMVDMVNKLCIHTDCQKHPLFNKEGETSGLYCNAHKKDGMVNVKHKKCIHLNCKKIPSYNQKGSINALYCNAHKVEGMVNVKNKICIYPDCRKQPTYNKKGEKHGLYCSLHKIEGMVNVVSRTCIDNDCQKIPKYNNKGKKKALYCNAHKLEGMVDVKNKMCIHLNCDKHPIFNKEGDKKPLYCNSHKLEGMVDVKNKMCKSDWCSTRVQKKYDGYCLFCYMNLFPDKPVCRNYKTKEFAVVEYVKTQFPNLPWVADKIINGGCSKRRPDLLLDLLYQIVIIEVDENQHTNYDCSCQNKRIMELSQDLGHRPIVFIRFNPDDYKENEKNVTSCWGQDKKGICVVKKTKKNEWAQRLNVLEQHINYWLTSSNKTNKTIETIQLFYDV